MSLDSIDNDPPMTSLVQCPQRPQVSDLCRADEGLFILDALQVVDRVLSVGQHVLVQGCYGGVVVLNGVLQQDQSKMMSCKEGEGHSGPNPLKVCNIKCIVYKL